MDCSELTEAVDFAPSPQGQSQELKLRTYYRLKSASFKDLIMTIRELLNPTNSALI